MKHKKLSSALLCFTFLASVSGCVKKEPTTTVTNRKSYKLTVVHLNDIHSHLKGERKKLYFNGKKTYVEMGGIPRVVTKIKEIELSNPNTIVLNAGDMIQGTLYYTLFNGKATADLLNLINWDSVTLGNHEFDNGDEGLKYFLDNLKAPVVSANIVPEKNSPLNGYWIPFRVIEKNGEKIGIIGIGYSQKTKGSSNPGKDIKFLDEMETARKYAQILKNLGVNKIIVLSHYGMENDIKLAKKVPGVDVVIDGDSHSLLGDYSKYGLQSQYKTYPVIVKSNDGTKVCVASAWQYAYGVGKLDVNFDSKGNVINCSGATTLLLGNKFLRKENGKKKPVDVNTLAEIMNEIKNSNGKLEIVSEDPAAKTLLNKYSEKVNQLKQQVIGMSAEFLGHNRIPGDKWDGESYLPKHGSEIAPLVAKSFYEKVKNADLAIQNAGGVRKPIDKGPITIGEVYEMLPFPNTLYTIKMKGKDIKQVLEDALSNFMDNHGSTGSFPYTYGIRYYVNLSKPKGERISHLEIMDRKTKLWHSIDMEKFYTVVTNSYIASGKDGYKTFKTAQKKYGKGTDTYFGYAETFIDMVKRMAQKGEKLKKLPPKETPIQEFIK